MKLLIIGHARSGKDTCAEIIAENTGMTFQSSSMAAAKLFIFDLLKDKYGYKTFEECFEDRVNRRVEWHDLITEYNKDDKARLAKEILKGSDCYVGMRSGEEINECIRQGLFDLIVWIDAPKRVPEESLASFQIDKSYADIIIDNNETEEIYRERVEVLADLLLPHFSYHAFEKSTTWR